MATQRWNIDTANSRIQFSVRKLMVATIRGTFQRFSGSLELDEQNLSASSVSVSIESASLKTAQAKRDEHLRTADFFDVAKYPQLNFQSTRVTGDGQNLQATGQLTMHGVTREITLAAQFLGKSTDASGRPRVTFQASAKLNRLDYGIKPNPILDAGGIFVSREIGIDLKIQAVPA